MNALTDLLVSAFGGDVALVLVLVGLFGLNAWQTRHFDKRFSSVEDRVQRAESVLITGEVATDGGQVEEDDVEEVDE